MAKACNTILLVSSCLAACASAGDPRLSNDDAHPLADARLVVDDSNRDAVALADGSSIVDATIPPDGTSSGCAFTGTLASWSFVGATGSQTSTTAAVSAAGIMAGAITRSAAITAATGAGSMNASGWPTSTQLDPASYYTLSIAPRAGCTLTLTSLAVDAKASASGPANGAIATSADAFAQRTTLSTVVPSTLANTTGPVSGNLEIRIYGYAATGSTGTMRLQNQMVISGSVQ